MNQNNFTYRWNLSDLKEVKPNGLKVFSCFACGGGSSMGYKMSGFEVLGANDIDPVMAEHYKINLNPKYYYLEDIRDLKKREDLPQELFDLDILDGSPPCSSFSVSGNREKDWGKEKVFREGQAKQTLDDLFFEFIDVAKKIRPKVAISENVKGILLGNAKGYVKEIIEKFDKANYETQIFLLDASTMGVPQERERVFFISRRKDLRLPELKLSFNEKVITVRESINDIIEEIGRDCSHSINYKYWEMCKEGQALSSVHPRGSLFNDRKVSRFKQCPTITTKETLYRWDKMATFSTNQLKRFSSFPTDYKGKDRSIRYLIGMSVPPIMMYKVSREVQRQLFLT